MCIEKAQMYGMAKVIRIESTFGEIKLKRKKKIIIRKYNNEIVIRMKLFLFFFWDKTKKSLS